MRKILIVGAGQCGLLLGHGLLQAGGYEVTILSARTPAEIRWARPTSTQVMFGPALEIERAHQLDLWSEQTPGIAGLRITLPTPDGERLDFCGALRTPARSTDQRIKMAGWLELFERRGGTVHTLGVSTRDLDEIAASGRYDLIVVAAGRGELTALFDRDPERSPFTEPQRALAAAYVHGMGRDPDTELWPNVTFTTLPGAGELILIPALSTTGPCDIVFWEAVPGGPLDVFAADLEAAEHLARAVGLIETFTPWLYERCAHLELTDARATLAGRYTPTVRHPVGQLPSGGLVLGAADVIVANDPIAAQGANSAARCAAVYLDAIVEHGDGRFDPDWMRATFDRFWADSGAMVTAWTNTMLGPPPEHVLRVFAAAAQYREVGDRLANGFADPTELAGWLVDPVTANAYVDQVAAAGAAPSGGPATSWNAG